MSSPCYVFAAPGCHFVCTEAGYAATSDAVKPERAPGAPIRGFEYMVPASWLQKGYVVAKEVIE